MNIKNKIDNILSAYLDTAILNLEIAKHKNTLWGMYAESGKEIFEISNRYPANEVDAAIIFEEWCKGLLSECRPDHPVLRKYAAYTADPVRFHEWAIMNKSKE